MVLTRADECYNSVVKRLNDYIKNSENSYKESTFFVVFLKGTHPVVNLDVLDIRGKKRDVKFLGSEYISYNGKPVMTVAILESNDGFVDVRDAHVEIPRGNIPPEQVKDLIYGIFEFSNYMQIHQDGLVMHSIFAALEKEHMEKAAKNEQK